MKAKRINAGKNINPSDRKEKGYSGTFLVVDKDFNEKVNCRIYWTETRCYCCLWVSDVDGYQSGSGWAGGYGYCKESAAVQQAIDNAGYRLYQDKKRKHCSISGVGREAIESALRAIGRLTTRKKLHLIHTHA